MAYTNTGALISIPWGIKKIRILLTGGAGYIGSHTYLALREAGHEAVIFDNFSNSNSKVLDRLAELFQQRPQCIEGDIRNREDCIKVLTSQPFDAVIHFAGLKAVGEGEDYPLKYYDNNVSGTLTLLDAMGEAGVKRIIFSSSATVYGNPEHLPISEDHPLSTSSVYGATKLAVEDVLRSLAAADPEWTMVILRYFNPVGAHKSARIGESPEGIPNNLMPFVTQVAVGRLEKLNIFGNDYDTPDGTGVRDYIHVQDLAEGHVEALSALAQPGCEAINLGTGRGYSVLEIIKTFERVNDVSVPHEFAARRPGDIAACWADPQRAKTLLNWEAKLTLEDMCRDAWRWQSENLEGY